LAVEALWLEVHYADKAVVVGGGPSVSAPAGRYIDMFARVVRVNDFKLLDAQTTGLKATDVVIQKAVGAADFSRLSREHILLSTFGENESAVGERLRAGSGLSLSDVTLLPAYYHTGLKQEMGAAAGLTYYDAVMQTLELHHPLTGTIALAWALRTTTARPVYFTGFDMMLGGDYVHGQQQAESRVSTRSLSKWHKIEHDRADARRADACLHGGRAGEAST